jgi:catechol 2,3-dioxygenase-like lactoylglutathione lyase family enzyme
MRDRPSQTKINWKNIVLVELDDGGCRPRQRVAAPWSDDVGALQRPHNPFGVARGFLPSVAESVSDCEDDVLVGAASRNMKYILGYGTAIATLETLGPSFCSSDILILGGCGGATGYVSHRVPGFDDKIVSMSAHGMSAREIVGHLRELDGIDVLPDLVRVATDAVLEEIAAGRVRPLEPAYPLIFFDPLRVKVRDEGVVRNKAVASALPCAILSVREGAKVVVPNPSAERASVRGAAACQRRYCSPPTAQLNEEIGVMLRNFDHLTIVVQDLRRAKEFFAVLGFKEAMSVVIDGEPFSSYMGVSDIKADHVTLVLENGSPRTEIQLLRYQHPDPLPDAHIRELNKIGMNHICFAVDDIEGEVAKVRAHGFKTRNQIMNFHSRKLVFIDGPEGVTIELAEWH